MEDAMKIFLPDVRISTEAAVMLNWDKNADTVLDANGQITVWTPAPETQKAEVSLIQEALEFTADDEEESEAEGISNNVFESVED